ncbi:MAG: Tat pathway signal protein [Eggerthellaceae bacterium]|jgi:hypothetical protein
MPNNKPTHNRKLKGAKVVRGQRGYNARSARRNRRENITIISGVGGPGSNGRSQHARGSRHLRGRSYQNPRGGRGARFVKGRYKERPRAPLGQNVKKRIPKIDDTPLPQGTLPITRRQLVIGASAIAGIALVGTLGPEVVDAVSGNTGTVDTLKVPTDAVTQLDSLTLIEDATERMEKVGEYNLDYGTLVYANDDKMAALLLPTEEASPLAKLGVLNLSSGDKTTVLSKAVGENDGYSILDVRGTSNGMIWVEGNILENTWRVYVAALHGSSLGDQKLVDEGDSAWQIPTLAMVGNHAFWQVVPKDEKNPAGDSALKRVDAGSDTVQVMYTCSGKMGTHPYGTSDSLIFTPHMKDSSSYYQLTKLDAGTGEVQDSLVLPRNMQPLETAYGANGFMFSFDAIYDYGEGISNLGTYSPKTAVTDGNYSDVPWFSFGRSPTAAPAWCGKYMIVKSTNSVCGIDLQANEYFALDVENGADDYGEYLATTGTHDTIVTFTNIDYTPVNGDAVKQCKVKVWKPKA